MRSTAPTAPAWPGSGDAGEPTPAVFGRASRDLWISLLVLLVCLLVYNANLRLIGAGDTYPARFLPFDLWHHHTLLLDPIANITAQGRPVAAAFGERRRPGTENAYWMVRTKAGHLVSLYPVVTPIVVAPLYVPAVAFLNARGWDPWRLDRVARIMEKLSASLLAATSAALLYLLLRRRSEPRTALLLTLAYAFGTTTWVISSQSLWQHGLGELLVVAMLLAITGRPTTRGVLAAGLFCGLIACNRPPNSVLAAALGIYGLWWARRKATLLVAAALLPLGLLLAYNLGVVGHFAGGYGLAGRREFFEHDLLEGFAGLLFSPTRGLFVFSPFLLFLPLALRDRSQRGLTAAIAIAVVVQLAVYAKADWRQGASWGPRWLTDLLPMLVWLLPPVVGTLRRASRIAFVAACVASIAIEAAGAFWYRGLSDAAIFAVRAGPAAMRAAWNPRNAPFLVELRHPQAPPDLAMQARGGLDILDVDRTAIYAEGWALAARRTPGRVLIMLDGRVAASTTTFFERPDVVKALGTTSPSGWRAVIQAPDLVPGRHLLSVMVRAVREGGLFFVADRRFTVLADQAAGAPGAAPANDDLALGARRAAASLASLQQPPGYWLTSYTDAARFERPRQEMNTYLTSVMIDVLDPVAADAGLGDSVRRARSFLSGQIEVGGLVRYHGRPDAPTIGTLGCAITPDSDDTALVWRIAPGARPELLRSALATLGQYRAPEGLYRTWLAPQSRFQCIDPGRDPDPADAVIQMHVLMLLAKADPPAARELCGALRRTIGDDNVWVYYKIAPVIPILRQADLRKAGCPVGLPPERLRTAVPGQEDWAAAARLIERFMGKGGPAPRSAEVLGLLRGLSSTLRRSPPLLYHNDLTARVARYYWSQEMGYAIWLRLYFENLRRTTKGAM